MWRAAMACAAVCMAAAMAGAEPLYLVKDGKPAATIVIPDKADRWTTMPAQWLRAYAKKATGVALEIVPDTQPPAGNLVSVGDTRLAREAGVDLAGLSDDACRLKVKGQVLFLRGPDVTDMGSYGPKGTCRAVTAFLERFCGVRWLVPTPDGEFVSALKDVSVPADLDVVSSPAFLYARPSFYGSPDTSPAAYANNTRTPLKLKSYGGHSYYDWVPAEKLFKEHPEYFAVINGQRTPHGNHLCLSNPSVRQMLLKGIREQFDAGHDWVQLGQEDGFQACQCAECAKLDEYRDHNAPVRAGYATWLDQLKAHPCERLLELHRWIAEECLKSHPNKTVHLLVYGPTLAPSKRFDKWPSNVVAEMCSDDPGIVGQWKDKVRGLTGYIYIFDVTLHGGLGVRTTPRGIARFIRRLHAMRFVGIATCIGGDHWGLEGPVYYTEARLLGDVSLDERQLVQEYCRGLYGKAAAAMKDFFDLLYTRGEDEELRRLGGAEADRFLFVYTPDFLARLERFLRRAEHDAEAEREKQWVKLTRESFEYLKRLVGALVAYRAYLVTPTDAAWAVVRDQVNAFDEWRDGVIQYDKDYAARWFPSYERICNFLTAQGRTENYYAGWWSRREKVLKEGVRGTSVGYLCGSEIRVPFVLDMARPPVAPPLVVRYSPRPPKLYGVLGDPLWREATPVSLFDMSSARTAVKTTVRALYDDQAIYVGWECEEPRPETMRLDETGRDGPAYSRECVELFLDIESAQRRYYHFIAAPQRNTFYDEACGFGAPGVEDMSWNGEWTYAYHVDAPNRRWTLEMRVPFQTLGAKTPAAGEMWMGNFGRERYADAHAVYPEPGIFIWSRREAAGLNTPLNFGNLRFERP